MTLEAIKPGGYSFGENLSSSEMNLFQTTLLKCIDGYGGGKYPNENPIEILGTFVCDGQVVIAGGYTTIAGGSVLLSPSTLTLSTSTTVSGPLAINYDTSLTKNLTLSGTGRIRKSVITGTNADHTYAVSDANVVAIDSPALTGSRAYTLSTTNAANGDTITFFMMGTDGSYNITIGYGGSQPVVMNASVLDKARSATFLYYSSAWHPYQIIENK